jgi:hypothetical protein
VAALTVLASRGASAGSLSFGPQTRLGFSTGDQWEPAVWGEGANYDSPGSLWYARGR